MSRSEYVRDLGVGALGALSVAALLRGAVVFLYQDITMGLFTIGTGALGLLAATIVAKVKP